MNTDWLADMTPPPQTGTCACGAALYWKNSTSCEECRERARAERERRREAVARARATVPPLFAAWASAGLQAPAIREWVWDGDAIAKLRATPLHRSIVLQGPAGAGKTSLACARLFDTARASMSVHFSTAYRLAFARSQTRLGTEADDVSEAIRASVTVVDDLGLEPTLATSAVGHVLHERHAAGRATIVTTGFRLDALRERLGDGITRRIYERAVVIDVRPRPAKGGGK